MGTQGEIKKKKAEVSKHTTGVKTLQREVQTAELELGAFKSCRAFSIAGLTLLPDRAEQMETDIAAGGVELADARTSTNKTRASLEELKSNVEKKQKELRSIEGKIAEETKLLTAFTDELAALDGALKAKSNEIAEGDLTIKELEHEIERLKKDLKSAADAVHRLESQYDWISDECQ